MSISFPVVTNNENIAKFLAKLRISRFFGIHSQKEHLVFLWLLSKRSPLI